MAPGAGRDAASSASAEEAGPPMPRAGARATRAEVVRRRHALYEGAIVSNESGAGPQASSGASAERRRAAALTGGRHDIDARGAIGTGRAVPDSVCAAISHHRPAENAP